MKASLAVGLATRREVAVDEGRCIGFMGKEGMVYATPLGLKVTIDVKIVEIDRRRVTFDFTVRDPLEECGRGRHVRFVVDKAKSRERLAAKRAKAGLA